MPVLQQNVQVKRQYAFAPQKNALCGVGAGPLQATGKRTISLAPFSEPTKGEKTRQICW